jgi:hypothetical protein
MNFTLDGRPVDVARMTDAARQEMATEVFHRLWSRLAERRWKKAAGNLWRLICLWSA